MFGTEYPAFSKHFKRSKGRYNLTTQNIPSTAEKWFEERQKSIKPENKINIIAPGLIKNIINPCKKCNTNIQVPVITSCCKNTFCMKCYHFESELYNRCFGCKKVINHTKYNDYDNINLKIPTYDNFDYIE